MSLNSIEKTKVTFVIGSDIFEHQHSEYVFVKEFIKHAPSDFSITVVGITWNKKERPPGKLIHASYGGKDFIFLPIHYTESKTINNLFDLLVFMLKLFFIDDRDTHSILFFQRLGYALALCKRKNRKIFNIQFEIKNVITLPENRKRLLGLFRQVFFFCENKVFRRVDHIYVAHRESVDFYQNKYPYHKHKISFLSNFCDRSIFYPLPTGKEAARISLRKEGFIIPSSVKCILFVGRLSTQKAPFRLIDTFKIACEKNNNLALLIVGNGNLYNETFEYVKKSKLEGEVYFYKFVVHEMMPLFYNASDVLLLTSNFEGCPFVVLEALGCGVPVVTTNVGEVKRFVHNGFSGEVVNSFDPVVIAEAVQKVINNSAQYTQANCIRSVSEYTPDKIFHPVYDMLRKLARINEHDTY